MKRGIILFIAGIVVIAGAAAQTDKTMYVATKNVELKSSTGFFAETVAVLQYGEQVTVLRENNRWMEVRPVNRATVTGWILANSLTSQRIVTGTAASVSPNELALAGIGFSEEIESAYKQTLVRRNAPVNYAEIDTIEAQNVSEQELYDFLMQGHLKTGDN